MARVRRRRLRTGRARRKTRRGMRRRASRAGPRRYRAVNQSRVYTFTRSTEVTMYNFDPDLGSPDVFSTDFAYLGPFTNDTTGHREIRHTNFGFSINDSFNRLQANSEFTNLFEYVRIASITRTFYPLYGPGTTNSVDAAAPKGFCIPTLMVLSDKDSNEPVTMAQARESSGVRRIRMNKPYRETFRPVPSMPVGATTLGGSAFAVVPKRAPWLAAQEAGNIQHYGRRYGVYDWPGPSDSEGIEGDAVPCAWRVISSYRIQCKGLK